MAALSDDELRAGLAALTAWELGEGEIVTSYRFDDFRQAVAFVVRAGFEAEAADHHPDLDVRYNRVRVGLSTHSEGGVTDKDLQLAAALDAVSGLRGPNATTGLGGPNATTGLRGQ
ncbi:MAG: 4a-hydroxytetrahydrobiopterin dehydratase [Acidimicrobiales bacterium]